MATPDNLWDTQSAYRVAPTEVPAAPTPGLNNVSSLFAERPAFVRRVALAMAFEPPKALARGRRYKPVGP